MKSSQELSVFRAPGESSQDASARYHELRANLGLHTLTLVQERDFDDSSYYVSRLGRITMFDYKSELPSDFDLKEVAGSDTMPEFTIVTAVPFNEAQEVVFDEGYEGFVYNSGGFPDLRESTRKNLRWAEKHNITIREMFEPRVPTPQELIYEAVLIG